MVSRDWLGKIESPSPTEVTLSGRSVRLIMETKFNELFILSDIRQELDVRSIPPSYLSVQYERSGVG